MKVTVGDAKTPSTKEVKITEGAVPEIAISLLKTGSAASAARIPVPTSARVVFVASTFATVNTGVSRPAKPILTVTVPVPAPAIATLAEAVVALLPALSA